MWRYLTLFRFSRRRLRSFSLFKHCLMFVLFLCSLTYIVLKIILLINYYNTNISYPKTCQISINSKQEKSKTILFWTKIFSQPINSHFLNNHFFTPTGRCATEQCRVTNDRHQLCQSDAVIFHARGAIKTYDMPEARLPHQRYVLLTKEPPYKTTAIVGYLNNFFNWTATVNTSYIYLYFSFLCLFSIE